MANFEAEVRLYDVPEADAVTARRVIEERLKSAGFQHSRVVSIIPQQPPRRQRQVIRPRRGVPPAQRPDAEQGAWVVVAAVAWAIWFVWLLGGG